MGVEDEGGPGSKETVNICCINQLIIYKNHKTYTKNGEIVLDSLTKLLVTLTNITILTSLGTTTTSIQNYLKIK